MDLGIRHKIAFVAAASRGLGKAAAVSLAKEGVRLAICSRDSRSITAAAEEISGATGVEVLALSGDVSSASDCDRMIRSTLERFGTIDILVNNAGGPPAGGLAVMTDDDWRKGFDLTVMSAVRLSRAVVPLMERQRWGRIITIVSIAAKQPVNDLLISSSIRPGILGLSKILANQYGRDNITVNTVCPGYILTDRQKEIGVSRARTKNITFDDYLLESARNIPAGRLGKPEEVGDLIAFLASQNAAFINGANILIDGGQAQGIH